MKVIQTVPSIGFESSGPSYSVPGLCRGLSGAGVEIELHVPRPVPPLGDSFRVVDYRQHALFHLRGTEWSSDLRKGLQEACRTADIIHTNGLWMMPNVYSYWAIKRTKCKFVIQPRGTLSDWALRNSKWKKRFFGLLMQYDAMRHADMWVATADEEYRDIRRLGYRQPVCILPNGIDLPSTRVVDGLRAKRGMRRRMYFLSRIHPKKNVDLLLMVWARLENRFRDWDLFIVGPDKNNPYADEMKRLAQELDCKRVTFAGELNGEAKLSFVVQSDCIVLPTHSENFGMVIAEALACGIPAICSHGAPWKGLNSERCGWWVPMNIDDFERAMSAAMSMSPDALLEMGGRGRDWMRRDFSWEGIGEKMKTAYEWLVNGGDRPEYVKID